jgi:hypothetical protein
MSPRTVSVADPVRFREHGSVLRVRSAGVCLWFPTIDEAVA